MPTSNSVPAITFGPTGVILPQEADILAGVQADINSAFGGGVNPALTTPQGQLATSLSAIIGDKNNEVAQVVNQVDPQFSDGRFQDAIGHLYFMERIAAVSTSVVATITGLAGTVIPVNAQAQATDGSIYVCTGQVTIPSSGTVQANFAAIVPGPTACPAGTLNVIYQQIIGWDRITNAADGVIGSDVESRSDFEYRRQQTVAINAQNSIQAIKAAVFNVANVIDVYVTENPTASAVSIGSVSLLAHSLWVAVSGGLAADIAQAIWSKKAPGCDYNGDTTATVYDTSYAIPQPQYTIKWKTATPTPILFAVQIANSPYLPPNAAALIKAAIVSAFSGGDGGSTARIGSTIYAGRFYAPVLAVATTGTVIQILSLQLGIGAANQNSVTMGIDQVPTVSAANITVTLV